MSILRELLKNREPLLYDALQKAWDIAHNEIFPAVPAGGESLNSYPHVKNLENYLNSILPTDDSLFDIKSTIHITSYELYCRGPRKPATKTKKGPLKPCQARAIKPSHLN